MKSTSTASFLAMIVLLGWSGVAAAQGPPESRAKKPKADPAIAAHAEASETLVKSLWDLVAWCEKVKLDRERAKVLDLILVFQPEDAKAREALGFVTAKGGGWERAKTWKAPENRDNDGLKDFKAKRAEVGGAFLDAMAKVIEEERRDIGPAIKARIIGDMNAIDPNDARTRGAAGEAMAGGKWVLKDAAQGPQRRKQLQGFAAAAIKAAGTPEPDEIAGSEGNWDIKWVSIVSTENLRVMGTCSKEETAKIAVLCQASAELFAKTFDTDNPHKTAYKRPIYVISEPTAKANFLIRNTSIKPDKREYYAKLGAFDVDGAMVVWANDTPARIDVAVRHMIGDFMGRTFGIGSDEGAIYEGVGIHLSWFLTGTRLSWTIGQRKYAQSGGDGLQEKLKGRDADWFTPGFDLVAGKNTPPLKPLFAKMVNDLETEDMLAGFMFGVWLLEGRKDDAPRFLRRAGNKQLEEGAREAFGLEFNEMEQRWVRWAKEARNLK